METMLRFIKSLSFYQACSTFLVKGRVVKCTAVTRRRDLPKHLGTKHWIDRLKDSKAVFLWKLEDVETVPERPVRLTFQKYRARHFLMSRAQLENGMKIDLPSRLSLHSTSGFFLKLLGARDLQLLGKTATVLNGHKIRIGTTCSGSDIGVTAVKTILLEINRYFRVSWHQPGIKVTCSV